ncbi:hypothetical protein WJX72_006998 [[Myrmecia] bisecta]|uniref:RRM domain-containing protein n=1 Tax=[Myrmecia] bisecta TaxID=41462 RepID=A0AAW1Q845_9CHLO
MQRFRLQLCQCGSRLQPFLQEQLHCGQSREQPQAYFRASFPIQIRNLGRRTLRTDLAAFLQRLNVDESDIRVEYDQQLLPVAWWVDLKTEDDRNIALSYHRSFLGPRRAYITGETAKSMRVAILSPLAMGSRGRYCLMTGIQNSATLEDIVRFFKGFDIMGNSVTIVKEQVYDSKHPTSSQQRSQDKRSQEKIASALGVPDEPDHRAVIRFETTEEAHRAVRTKHGSHLLNKSVRLRVLP